ncbi:MAG TPA: hypothetical protein VHH36_09110 [Candidatus Thermoplasmatota archaeon]|nr:hypothetical protein [Candidatus Thermoplasmatota archaeon]
MPLFALVAVAASGGAHFPQLPYGACTPRADHDYLLGYSGGTLAIGSAGLQMAYVFDSCTMSDGDPEFGFGGAFLPDTHHAPDVGGFTVVPIFTDGPFVFGSDGDPDGIVSDLDPDDCYETYAAAGTYVSSCAAGADGGWWFFGACGTNGCIGSGHVG